MSEGLNPTRRYKWFRPRQAARGSITITTQVNNSIVTLYNDSTAAQVLVVRGWAIGNGNPPAEVGSSYFNGKLGTQGGTVRAIWPDSGKLPGILTSLESTTNYAFDWVSGRNITTTEQSEWPHDFPFAILPPNWSLVFSDRIGNSQLRVSFLWEAVFPDELDYAFEL